VTRATDRLGRSGERYAADFLTRHGYEILERNVRRREGEVDLVARRADVTVFIEVKVRRPGGVGRATEALSPQKRRRLAALAEAYAAEHPDLPANLRIDLVAVQLDERGSVEAVQHIENAVEGEAG
jgi:putative endonuclease